MTRDDLEDFTGDRAGAEILRRSLRALADQQPGTPLADRVTRVLAGRLPFRELAADPDLVAFADDGMRAFDEEWQELSPEEREAATAAGTAEVDALERRLRRT